MRDWLVTSGKLPFALRSVWRNGNISKMESAHISKLFSILEATSGKLEGRSLAVLAAEIRLAKSTTHRLLQSLCSLGYMVNDGSGIYKQTPLFRQLASGFDDHRLIELARDSMVRLRESFDETINLGVMRMERVVYLNVLESSRPVTRTVESNMSDPALSTALGRAIVAFQSHERQQYVIRKVVLEKQTPHTVVGTDKLEAILDQVRIDGYAIEENQTDLGVMCVAAPIFDVESVVAAISMTCPIARMGKSDLERAVAMIREIALDLSEQLGFHAANAPR